ncbi:MAG TPA: DUF4912 domain-containing protein [Chthoniobacterales bacterium]|nr:DUF4912 domain-containing protein [Chthoniobacterales bacterium]
MSQDSAENKDGFRVGAEPDESGQNRSRFESVENGRIDELGELPSGYGQMFIIARDPHWLFTYWDYDYATFPEKRRLLLQVFRGPELETTIEINELARNWYIPVQQADADYRVEFVLRGEDGAVSVIGEAGPTHTPPESISPQWDSQFATVPFHLGFNFLLDVIDTAKAKGEPLTQALARLQQAAASNLGGPSSWSASQLHILETLLGKAFVGQLSSMNSDQLASYLRTDLAAQLDSESASELLAKGRLAQLLAPEASSLFSGFQEIFGGGLSSAGVTSLGVPAAAESSETLAASSESLASWQSAAGSETRLREVGLSSFEIAGGLSSGEMSSQVLSSFAAASELGALGLSSAELGALGVSSAELGALGVSSAELGALGLSSAELGALGLSSAELSSAALSSAAWSGLEFPLSSWSELASESSLWSGFASSWSGPVERGFFMHVNAEVIFYGGTDPRAKVTVAGQPIQLQPDGTFRYHFKFPDNDFEIPIVAVSPDGQETRSAVLYFRRDTTRQGEVGATGQPAHLGDLIGAKR